MLESLYNFLIMEGLIPYLTMLANFYTVQPISAIALTPIVLPFTLFFIIVSFFPFILIFGVWIYLILVLIQGLINFIRVK